MSVPSAHLPHLPHPRRLVALIVVALIVALVPLAADGPPAGATPVASNDAAYAACGRVFADPQAYGPSPAQAPGKSPWAKGNAACRATYFITWEEALAGLGYLDAREDTGPFLEIINLAETEDPAIRAALEEELGDGMTAGLPAETLEREQVPLYLIKVTAPEGLQMVEGLEPIAEEERDHFVFPLSIHGIERAGVEGGIRAIEDLVTWGANEPERRIMETYDADTIETFDGLEARNLPVGEVLMRSVSYFMLANPDGWRRGDPDQQNPAYQRYNGNGMDMNRDWPAIGYTEHQYTPWSEPETRSFGRSLQAISDTWSGGVDLHGQLIDRAFSFTLIGGSQRPYGKNERVQQFVEQAYADAELRLQWSSLIKPNDEPPACAFVNDPTTEECDPTNRIYGVQYGTIWDTINYTVTGAVGDWIDSPIGLNGDGIDNEMSLSHLSNCATGTCYIDEAEQLHVDGNKSLIYGMLNFSLQPPTAVFDLDGSNVAYLVNPRRLVDEGFTHPQAPPGATAPEALSGIDAHVAGTTTTLTEFDVANTATSFTGGIAATVTLPNAGGESPGAVNAIHVERQIPEGEEGEGTWERLETYFNQSAGYRQAGMRVDENHPEDGHYRVVMTGAAPLPLFAWDITFTTGPAWPEIGQAPFDVSNSDFFAALEEFVGDGTLTGVDTRSVLDGSRDLLDFDTVVVADDAFLPGYRDDVDEEGNPIPNEEGKNALVDLGYDEEDLATVVAAMTEFVEAGGNLVLTDDALRGLEWMGIVPDGSVHQKDVYAGHVSFSIDDEPTYEHPLAEGINRPGAAEGSNRRRQTTEPVPIGYKVPVSRSGGVFQPQWYVDRAAFEEAGGTIVGGDDTDSDSDQRVSLGEVPVGEGRIRVLGSLLPYPTTEFDHIYGLSSYAVTDSGYILSRNLWRWQNPGQNEEPDLEPDPIDPVPGPGNPPLPTDPGEVVRWWGAGRIETAADVSRNAFSPGEGRNTYIATAADFPDALAGGPAAFLDDAPMLLTHQDELPAATRDELERLRPETITVLGGTAAVSDAVLDELRAFASVGVERVAGAERFETAAQVSATFADPGLPTVYVATGVNFADTLSGGPAAGRDAAPIVLVARDEIPQVTAAELERLRPGQIVVLGGSDAVSDAVVEQLRAYADDVVRYAGSNRFATSAAVSAAEFSTTEGTVFIATGGNFPDGLAGGPAAATNGAPILLVDDDLSDEVVAELERLQPRRIVVLGGVEAVSEDIETSLRDYVPSGDEGGDGDPLPEPDPDPTSEPDPCEDADTGC